VMNWDSLDARNDTKLAISSGSLCLVRLFSG
jgi:hypothetical protein